MMMMMILCIDRFVMIVSRNEWCMSPDRTIINILIERDSFLLNATRNRSVIFYQRERF